MWWLVVQRLRRARREHILFWSLIITLIGASWLVAVYRMRGFGGNETAENVLHSLKNTSCPAQPGLGLEDYWRCLFGTTITAKGWEQDRQIKLHFYHERLRLEQERVMERRKRRCSNETLIPRRRVRRQTNPPSPLLPFDPNDVSTQYSFQKMLAISVDLNWLDDISDVWSKFTTFPRVRECQLLYVWPGVSIRKFIRCLQEIMSDFKDEPDVQDTLMEHGFLDNLGQSLHSTFQPTTYPPMRESKFTNDFSIPIRVYITNASRKFELHFDFQPLNDEEHLDNFEGADAFLDDNFSPYRYRYDNLKRDQDPPPWSYRGRYPSSEWHLLDENKFFVPQYRDQASEGDVKVEVLQELVQSYPGVGEIMGGLKEWLIREGANPNLKEYLNFAKFIATLKAHPPSHIAIPFP